MRRIPISAAAILTLAAALAAGGLAASAVARTSSEGGAEAGASSSSQTSTSTVAPGTEIASVTASSDAAGDGVILADLGGDYLYLIGFEPDGTVRVEIGDDFADDVRLDDTGFAVVFRPTHGQDLVPGMVVTAGARTLALESVTFDELNPTTHLARGTAPPNRRLDLFVWTAGRPSGVLVARASITSDASGTWSWTFTEDIEYGMVASVDLADADGDFSRASRSIARPIIQVSRNSISLSNWQPGNVDVTVDGVTRPVGVGENGFGSTPASLFGKNLVPGIVVTADQGDVHKSLTLASLTASIDPETDTVSGTAPAHAPVNVDVFTPPASSAFLQVAASPSGDWTADFAGTFDIVPATNAFVFVSDDDGDITSIQVIRPSIHVSLTNQSISVVNWQPGSVDVTVDGVTRSVDIGDSSFGSAPASLFGKTLAPGVVITAEQGGARKSLTLVPLTGSTDPESDTVSGSAPADARVDVSVFTPSAGSAFRQVVASPSGEWMADFSGTFDIVPATSAFVGILDGDGDGIAISFGANRPPTASLTIEPPNGVVPLNTSVAITGEDLDADALSYTLDFGDGTTPITGVLPSDPRNHQYTRSGVFTARLSISDGRETAIETVTVNVGLAEPLTAVAGDDITAIVGQSVTFDGSNSRPLFGIEGGIL